MTQEGKAGERVADAHVDDSGSRHVFMSSDSHSFPSFHLPQPLS